MFRIGMVVSGLLALLALLVYTDVYLRARSAYYKAEKYYYYSTHPEQMREDLKREFQSRREKLETRFRRGKLSQQEYELEQVVLEGEYKRRIEESAIKNALVWYETVVNLFSPPRTRWVKEAEKKIPQCRAEWKAELRTKGIPVEDYITD